MSKNIKENDIVFIPCKVTGIGTMGYSEELIVDLQPIEKTSGECYSMVKFSVFEKDVFTHKNFNGG